MELIQYDPNRGPNNSSFDRAVSSWREFLDFRVKTPQSIGISGAEGLD